MTADGLAHSSCKHAPGGLKMEPTDVHLGLKRGEGSAGEHFTITTKVWLTNVKKKKEHRRRRWQLSLKASPVFMQSQKYNTGYQTNIGVCELHN